MLRRAENVGMTFQPNFVTGRGWLLLSIGRNQYRVAKVHKAEVQHARGAQLQYPLHIARVGDRTYWQFQNRFYWDNDSLTQDEVYALLVTREQRNRRQINNAVATVAMGNEPRVNVRGAIPDDVKQLVWIRDFGRCRACGSTTELQFDHVIPVSKGGASTAENLQILCGPCNRKKSAGLTTR